MPKIYPADTVGSDGTVYTTVGENIRDVNSKISSDNLINALHTDSDKQKIISELCVSSGWLKNALYSALTGGNISFGCSTWRGFNVEELSKIKTYLGIQ